MTSPRRDGGGGLREGAGAHRAQDLTDLVHGLDAIVWELDVPTMRFTFVSERARDLLGHPLESWVDFDSWVSMIHPDDRERARDHCLREATAGRDHELEYRAVAADGRTVWLRDIVRTVRDGRGALTTLRGLMIDVTALRRAAAEQAALRRVATAVAAGTPAGEVFELVAIEVAALLSVETGMVFRFEAAGATAVGSWDAYGPAVGARYPITGRGVLAQVASSGRVARAQYGKLSPDDRAARRLRPIAYAHAVAAPVRAGGRLWGAVMAATASPREPAADSEERLSGFAMLVALALSNAEDRLALARRAGAQDSLRRLATAVATATESLGLFALICREAAELFGADAAGVSRLAGDGRGRVLASWSRPGVAVPEPGRLARLRPAALRALRVGAAVGFIPREDDPSDEEPWRERLGYGVIAPIGVEGESWGVLTASADAPLTGQPEDVLGDFADLVATVALATRQRQALSDHAREQEALRRLTTMAAEGASPADVLTAAAPQVAALLGVRRGRVVRFGPEGARVVGTAGPDQPELGAAEPLHGDSAVARVAAGGRAARTEEDEPATRLVARGRRTTIAAPVRFGGGLWGAVVASAVLRESLPEGAQDRLERYAEALGVAAASAEAREALAARAATDPLTGLANYGVLQERLRGEFERARRHHRQLCLALFDLDRFKAINDRHGHQTGDRLLVAVAQILSAGARPGDLVARVGGDEIAWLMPEAEGLDGWQAADRQRQRVAEIDLPGLDPISVSVGVCEIGHARDHGDLYRLADGALYWAKAQGRGACFRYTPEVVAAMSAEERAERLQREQALTSVRLLARVVDAKDPSTRRHSERVAETAGRVAAALGWSAPQVAAISEAGLVHDVGKVGVPDAVLFKPGRLEPAEYEQVKAHAALGAQLVSEVLSADQVAWVRHHHERIDGAGYPDGLAGNLIPEGARVLAVADAWDVMTGVRSYRLPMSREEALAEVEAHRGSQFCPEVVAALRGLAASGRLESALALELEL